MAPIHKELTEREIFKQVCENDFAFFAEQFFKVLEPETDLEWNWHLNIYCFYCEQVYYGIIRNLDINVPPRSLKSIIFNVLFPCWTWTKKPSNKFLSGSSTAALSALFNQKRRELIMSMEFQSFWPILLKDDSNKISKFENTENGFMQAVSVGGSVVGEGADILLTDDLLDVNDAFSKAKREHACFWYSNAFYGRAQDKKTVRRINVNQRLHSKDISNHIAEKYDNFERLVIPMQKTEKNTGTIIFDDPREVGEFLQPSRYGQKEKDDEFEGLGNYGWSSQMQQSPVPIGGGIVKEEWLRYYTKAPEYFDRTIITGDLTFKGGAHSDYVCFQAWGVQNGIRYLLDIVRGKWSYKITKEKFKDFVEKNKRASVKYIEDKANGPALIDDLKEEIQGIEAWPRKGSKYSSMDKVQRLHLCSQDYENGLVYLPTGINLVDEFVIELTSFTEKGSTTGNDDMVDTSTMALIEMKTSSAFFV